MNNLLTNVISDLRTKRLWPVALLLVAAAVAVPVLLSKSSKPSPAAPNPSPAIPAAPGLPVVSQQGTPTKSHLTGHSRDPFAGGGSSTTTTTTSTGTSTTSTTSSTTSTSSTSGGSNSTTTSASTGGGTAPQSTSTAPTSIVPPGTKPTKAPAALTSTQSYDVAMAITNSSGGLNTLDPLERLSVLPNNNQPLLVELGVLQGGHRVLFAVQPRTVVNGPGTCTPGPIDCEILSLGVDQTEGLSQQTASGVSHVALFAVTSISAVGQGSSQAADKVRRRESAAGRAVLDNSPLSALSLFRYEPSLGAVVDLRNLTVGG